VDKKKVAGNSIVKIETRAKNHICPGTKREKQTSKKNRTETEKSKAQRKRKDTPMMQREKKHKKASSAT
jgi:hypothetical protein